MLPHNDPLLQDCLQALLRPVPIEAQEAARLRVHPSVCQRGIARTIVSFRDPGIAGDVHRITQDAYVLPQTSEKRQLLGKHARRLLDCARAHV